VVLLEEEHMELPAQQPAVPLEEEHVELSAEQLVKTMDEEYVELSAEQPVEHMYICDGSPCGLLGISRCALLQSLFLLLVNKVYKIMPLQ
jgi:hypothetical protein